MRKFSFFVLTLLVSSWVLPGCVHELVAPEAPDVIPADTISQNPNDTLPDIPQDSADYTGVQRLPQRRQPFRQPHPDDLR